MMHMANGMNSIANIPSTVIQRLLAAVILLVAPCLNLPCCCQRAVASTESVGCCEQHRKEHSSSNPGSCCTSRHRDHASDDFIQRQRTCSCECQLNGALPAIRGPEASHSSTVDRPVDPAAFSGSWRLSSQVDAAPSWDSAAYQIPAEEHNRRQAALCVWRN